MSVIDDERDPLDELAEDFLERYRRGERPALSQFTARVPDRAGELRKLLSALLMVEDIRPHEDHTIGEMLASRPGGVEPGTEQLGDYRIIRELGRGGMGVVYEAEQVSLGRRVALKVISPGISRSSRQVQRFMREARSAAQLHHTNIVPVFGVGDQDGLYYYAMQFICGQGLDKVLNEVRRHRDRSPTKPAQNHPSTDDGAHDDLVTSATRLLISGELVRSDPPADRRSPADESSAVLPGETSIGVASDSNYRYARSVARIGVQVADALAYAHRHGTLHRDIKPSNLLLDGQGTVWVTDFGLAKAAEDDDLTQTGDFVGTLRYMAPERFRGICDVRSDIHALGLTLYELLALRPAFDAGDRDQLIYQITHRDPTRLSTLKRSIPRDLETIVHKAIEMDPGDRYASAGAVASDLRCFLEYRPIEARRAGSTERLTRWAKRNPGMAGLGTVVACLLGVMVLGISVYSFKLQSANRTAMFNLQRAECAEYEAVGKYLESALTQVRAGRRSGMAGRRFDGLHVLGDAARQDTEGKRLFAFRNEAIACLALADLRPVERWTEDASVEPLGLDFDPEAKRIARATPDGEIQIRDISDERLISTIPGPGLDAVMLRFSPNGRYLAAKHEEGGHVELAVYDVDRQEPVLRVPEGMYASACDFHPDGRRVAAGLRDGSVRIYDLATGRESSRLSPGTVPHALRFSPTGDRLAVTSSNSDVAVQVRNTADGRVMAEWTRPEGAMTLDWHPGGRWLAAGGNDGRIHLLDADNVDTAPRFLERHGHTVVELAFHPSGMMLASAAWDGTVRLWHVPSGRELVKSPLHQPRRLRFSRDGRFLGPGQAAGRPCLWEVAEGREHWPLVGGIGPIQIRSIAAGLPAGPTVVASPNGLILAADGAETHSTTAAMPGTSGAVITPDGSAVISGGAWGLLRWPIARSASGAVRIGPPASVTPRGGEPTLALALSRDGQTLAMIADDDRRRVVVIDLQGENSPVELIGHAGADRVSVSPDGLLVATGTWKGTGVRVWDSRTGKVVTELPVTGSASVLFSPDGRQLLTGSGKDYTLWNTNDWSLARRFAREQAGRLPGEAAFRDDGRLLAMTRSRSLVLLVDPTTGDELAHLESSDLQIVTRLEFRTDGRLLVASSGSDDVRAWDLLAVRKGLASLGLDWKGPRDGDADTPRPPTTIEVIPARWLEAFQDGEKYARSGAWPEATAAYRAAIEAGAPGSEPWSRLAMASVVLGDRDGYRKACRQLVDKFGIGDVAARTANNVAWACALSSAAMDDYETVVRLAETATAGRRELNRLNTLGAALYRAGRAEEAVEQLGRSVAAHGAGGTPYDAVFLAMAHHRLGHAEEAKKWLAHATEPAPVAMRKPDATTGPSSWIPRVELDILRREATTMIGATGQ